ncbi:hypothetical protein U1Q18_052179 [Sarracenia purpurea var. burkii]
MMREHGDGWKTTGWSGDGVTPADRFSYPKPPPVERDIGWIGFSTESQDALTPDVSKLSDTKVVQNRILNGRRRCAEEDTTLKLDASSP